MNREEFNKDRDRYILGLSDSEQFNHFVQCLSRNSNLSVYNNLLLASTTNVDEKHSKQYWENRGFEVEPSSTPTTVFVPVLEKFMEVNEKGDAIEKTRVVDYDPMDFYSAKDMVSNHDPYVPDSYLEQPIIPNRTTVEKLSEVMNKAGFSNSITDIPPEQGPEIKQDRILIPSQMSPADQISILLNFCGTKSIEYSKSKIHTAIRKRDASLFASIMLSKFGIESSSSLSSIDFGCSGLDPEKDRIYLQRISQVLKAIKVFEEKTGLKDLFSAVNETKREAARKEKEAAHSVFEATEQNEKNHNRSDQEKKLRNCREKFIDAEEANQADLEKFYSGGLKSVMDIAGKSSVNGLDHDSNNCLRAVAMMLLSWCNTQDIKKGKVDISIPSYELKHFMSVKTKGREDMITVFYQSEKGVLSYDIVSKNHDFDKTRKRIVQRALGLGAKSVCIAENGMFEKSTVNDIAKVMAVLDIPTTGRVQMGKIKATDTSFDLTPEEKESLFEIKMAELGMEKKGPEKSVEAEQGFER